MLNQQLLDYVRHQLQSGANREQIKNILLSNGWITQDIDAAFALAENQGNAVSAASADNAISSLPSATEIFGQTWKIFKQRLGTFLGIMVMPVLLSLLIEVIFYFIFEVYFNDEASWKITVAILLFFYLLFFIIQNWSMAALAYAIKDSEEKISITEAYRRGWNKFWSFWWISLLVGFITLGGSLLFAFPGLIFTVWFSFSRFILVAENTKGMNALLKSREYVRGKWGSVFWRQFFISTILAIFSAPILLAYWLNFSWGQEILTVIAGLFLLPLLETYLFLVYKHLRRLKSNLIFDPKAGKKAAFIIVGFAGVLIIPFFIVILAFSSIFSAKNKEQDRTRDFHLQMIQENLEKYNLANGRYPASLEELSPDYILYLPVSPKNNQQYLYYPQADGQGYEICEPSEPRRNVKCVTSTL